MQRVTNISNTRLISTIEDESQIYSEESEWTHCSEQSGFAAGDYRFACDGAMKRRRGTSIVHISQQLASTTEDEASQSSQDYQPENSGSSAISALSHDANSCSTPNSEDDT